ncbi:succinate dehydrogenase cytochrome b558 subunit [Tepidibacillus sp. LV47]|uniref:succinate dehydrogenase cytochrome b558 subunit n=1 Tax=Tepidibacillus sp. LV47 TaxID=3398228 RepID=UPI003AAAE9BD
MATSHFFNRRLHSLLGVIPVGVFLLIHLTVNYMATRGPESFNNAAGFMESLPFLPVLEWVLIFLPLLYHAIYGLYIAFQAKHNVGNFSYVRNIMFMLQRYTGIITLIFVGWHVWETRAQMALGTKELNFNMMADILQNNWMMAFYIVGVISAIFHFSNGMWSFLVSWGVTIGPRSQRISTYVWMTVFVLVSIVAISSLFSFTNAEYIKEAVNLTTH